MSRALCWALELLSVVIGRWQDGIKHTGACRWRDVIQVPVRNSEGTSTLHPYRAVAGVSHIGDSLHTGHYRAFWPENLRDNAQVWICDDYKMPEQASPAMLATIASTVYLLFLERIH